MKEQADPYGGGSYCIVVALHGDNSREAEALRDFRDRFLKQVPGGDRLIELYYRVSPVVTSKLGNSRIIQPVLSKSISLTANLLRFTGL